MLLNSPIIEKNDVVTEPFGIFMYITNNRHPLRGKSTGVCWFIQEGLNE